MNKITATEIEKRLKERDKKIFDGISTKERVRLACHAVVLGDENALDALVDFVEEAKAARKDDE